MTVILSTTIPCIRIPPGTLSAIPPESPGGGKERIVLTGEVPSPIGEQKGCPLANRCPRCMKRCRGGTAETAAPRGHGPHGSLFSISERTRLTEEKMRKGKFNQQHGGRSEDELIDLVSRLIRINSENPTGTQREGGFCLRNIWRRPVLPMRKPGETRIIPAWWPGWQR